MFKFLKDKIKGAISSFSKQLEEEKPEELLEEKKAEDNAEEVKEESKEEKKKKGKESKKEEQERKQEKKETHEKEQKELDEEKLKEKKAEFKDIDMLIEAPVVEPKTDLKLKKEKLKREDKEIKKTEFKEVEEVLEKAGTHFKKDVKGSQSEIQKEKKAAEKIIEEAESLEEVAEEEIEKAEELSEKENVKGDITEASKKGFFSRITQKITSTKISEDKFEELFSNLEIALLESNVAVEVIEKIKEDMKNEIVNKDIKRREIENVIKNTLKNSIEELFEQEIDLIKIIKEKKKQSLSSSEPFIIALVGINGVGKTTTVAKLAKKLQDSGLKTVIAAADTFRAAAIEQIEEHSKRLGIKLIKHDYGSDSAAVCYDAIAHAKAHKIDVVLIDTAGRSNVNVNLMGELKKVIRVAKPHMTIFIGDAVTGNDAVEQAKQFNEAVGINGIILAKSDVDEKGGSAISVSYVTKQPILYLGVGQHYDDLENFSKEALIKNLGLA